MTKQYIIDEAVLDEVAENFISSARQEDKVSRQMVVGGFVGRLMAYLQDRGIELNNITISKNS